LRDDRRSLGVFRIEAASFPHRGSYVDCSGFETLSTLTTAALNFVFLGIVVGGLGAAVVLMLWEIERQLARPHNRDRRG
jgi:hypothetical protein